jgi:hypothetical protein
MRVRARGRLRILEPRFARRRRRRRWSVRPRDRYHVVLDDHDRGEPDVADDTGYAGSTFDGRYAYFASYIGVNATEA